MVRKTPFVIENANRIRIIGFSIIGIAVLTMIRGIALGIYLMNRVRLPGFELGTKPGLGQIGMIVVGLIVLLLAEVFRYGISLQETQVGLGGQGSQSFALVRPKLSGTWPLVGWW